MKSEASFYKTYSLYNFYFERVLRFVIEYAWISNLLNDSIYVATEGAVM